MTMPHPSQFAPRISSRCSTSSPPSSRPAFRWPRASSAIARWARKRRRPTRSAAPMWRCCSRNRRCARSRRSRSPCASLAATSSRRFPMAALSEREPAVDVARNLERWVKCVVMRTYRALDAARVRESRAAPARGECAERHRASLPGARRSSDAEGSLGRVGRPHRRVRRRRQQRRDVAGAGRRHAGHDVPHRVARRLRAAGERGRAGDAGRAAWRADPLVPRSRRGRRGRRRRLHRRLDVDGPGSGSRGAEARVRRLSGDARR